MANSGSSPGAITTLDDGWPAIFVASRSIEPASANGLPPETGSVLTPPGGATSPIRRTCAPFVSGDPSGFSDLSAC